MDNAIKMDMLNYGVSVAVIAIDDFTGKIIPCNELNVSIEHEKPPIRKSDGFFVFLSVRQPRVTIFANGPLYNTQCEELELKRFGIDAPLVTLRMTPNRCYNIPENTTCIEGIAPAGALLKIFRKDLAHSFRLLDDYKPGTSQIGIYHSDNSNLDGKLLAVCGVDGEIGEYIRLNADDDGDDMTFTLSEDLKNGYSKIKTAVYPVNEVKTDELGSFFLPISTAGGNGSFVFEVDCADGRKIVSEHELEIGKLNRITLK